MKVVRCMKCGGRPMETLHIGVSHECRCKLSAWDVVDGDALFVWDEVEV